ncbi:MAG: hypothetical protein ABIT96_13300 [Ferruginibacter sp.]
MSKKGQHIFEDGRKSIDPDKVLGYLKQELDGEERHNLEAQSAEDPFLDDALEGLEQLEKKETVQGTVSSLNKNLHQLIQSTNKKQRGKLNYNEPWVYYTVILILLLCITAFIVVKKFLN